MPGICVLGDVCTGCSTCPKSRQNIEASQTVYIQMRGVHRVGDGWMVHCNHPGALAQGSPNVFVELRAVGRCHDPITCGSYVQTCISNVFANGL